MAEGLDRGRSRWHRWAGLAKLALGRVADGIRRPGLSRPLVAIVVVAVAVAVLVVVTGLSLGLATQPSVQSGSEYWIAPESASTLTTLFSTDGPQLGDVHATSTDLEAREDVDRATPVLVEVLELRAAPDAEAEYVVAVGIVPPADDGRVAGVSTAAMPPGDPHYAGGDYDGEFTGEVVLTPAAAELLRAESGESLFISRPGPGAVDQRFAVAGVTEEGARTIRGEAPVALFQLSELQTFTGADTGDQADQILVRADESAVPALEAAYPDATVVERGSLSGDRLADSDLPLAVSPSAVLVVLVVITLVIATAAGIDVEADRRQLAVFAALGLSSRTTTGLVVTRTLALAVLGGVVGTVLGTLGIVLMNRVVAPYFELTSIAVLDPLLVGYGIGIAIFAGLLAVPYPVALARRTPTLQGLTR
jgi:putative ABC transport system permease protein